MRFLFMLFFCFINSSSLQAQNDTIITYLDEWYKPCGREVAARYSKLYKEGDYWKKSVINIKKRYTEWTASFQDKEARIYEGLFISYHDNRQIMRQGMYINNKKTGLWKSWSINNKLFDSINYKDGFVHGIGLRWHPDGPVIDSLIFEEGGNGIEKGFWPNGEKRQTGFYVSGKKDGQWTYYYRTGVKCQEVIYKADSAISFTCYDPQGNLEPKTCVYEKEAEFTGGDKAWKQYLVKKLNAAKFPKAYQQGKIGGTVYVQFVVEIDGSLTNIKIDRSVHPELDEIAIRVISESPNWIPAVQNNRKVKAFRRQPIMFKQN